MIDGKFPTPNRIDFEKLKAERGAPPERPLPLPPPSAVRRRKRSLIVGLVALGAGSIALSMAMSRKTCDQKLLANPNDTCKTSSSTGSHSYSFGSSGHASGPTTSQTGGKSAVSHGGFGATGSHFSGHGG